MLNAYCPNLLYPYAGQVVNQLIGSASLPQTFLKPLDFNMVYQEQKKVKKSGGIDKELKKTPEKKAH